MTLLEAIASGKPVIAPASGGPLEILSHGISGILIDKMRPESLAAAMKSLICNPGKREAIAQTAREMARVRFAREKFLREMIKTLQICP
jgi:phosphatidylinositol alpha 1,6-mannosyltransferase